MSLRVLQVITDLATGGVPLHLYRLADFARGRGVDVSVCGLAPGGAVADLLENAGVPHTNLGAAGPWDWRVLERLACHIRDTRPDVVHALLFHANLACRAAAVLSGFPPRRLICEIQTVEIERRWHLWLDGLTQWGCRYVVGNSPSVIAHLRDRARIRPARLRLIPGGVDPTTHERAVPLGRRSLGLDNPDPILLWVGRLDPVKGLDELFESFERVQRACPANLLLAGEGAYRPAVERRIAQSPVAARVRLLGARADVPALLRSADVFVFPSRTEGMPNALLEAMAAGLPCVATNVPGNRDVLHDRLDGLLVKPRDPVHLAEAVLTLLRDRAQARRLGQAAAETVRRHFRLDRCLQAYVDLYREVAAD